MPSLVAVELHTSPWHAHIACGLLVSEGVHAVVANEHHVWANWRLSQALGGVRVLVPAAQLEQAAAVLRARDCGAYEDALCQAFGDAPPGCRSCGGRELTYVRDPVARSVAFVMTLVFGVSFAPAIIGTTCRACGTRI